jgi:serine protease DegS
MATRRFLPLLGNSAVVGLAIAFLVVLIRPDLVALPSLMPAPVASYAEAVADSSRSVVSIFTEVRLDGVGGNSAVPVPSDLGSGVIISSDGYLVTSWHVVNDVQQIRVQLADGRVAIPEIVGMDRETELALLRIDLPDLPAIKLGRSAELRAGDVVLAIGKSLGLSQSVTMGVVSATEHRQLGVATVENFIQTDAVINLSNSGGALVDARGELVGISTPTLSHSGPRRARPAGIAFAIPIDVVRSVMDQLIEHGHVIRGFLGVEPADLTTREAQPFGLDSGAVLLQRVWGPAAKAGLRQGDVLTHINGTRIHSRQHVMSLVASAQPGDTMSIRVVRVGGIVFDTVAQLEERPADSAQ